MASTKLAFLAVAVLLLQASSSSNAVPAAVMALTSFEDGDPAACDGNYHSNKDLIAALSTASFGDGIRCHWKIGISLPNGRNVVAEVVDECSCNDERIDVATSKRVWDYLGLDTNLGEVPVSLTIVSEV